jgi:two-component system OmpR family response regulator
VRIITVRGLGYCLEKAASPASTSANAMTTPPPAEPEPPASPPSGAMPASHHYK